MRYFQILLWLYADRTVHTFRGHSVDTFRWCCMWLVSDCSVASFSRGHFGFFRGYCGIWVPSPCFNCGASVLPYCIQPPSKTQPGRQRQKHTHQCSAPNCPGQNGGRRAPMPMLNAGLYVDSFIHSFVRSFVRSVSQTFMSLICSLIDSIIPAFMHLFTR